MHSSKKIRLLKIAVSITCVIVMLFAVCGISTYASIRDELIYPSSIPVRSGYVDMDTSYLAFVPTVDDFEFILGIMNAGADSPFRYRFTGQGYSVFMYNFTLDTTNPNQWVIRCDDGFVVQQTAFVIDINADGSCSVRSVDVEFVCTVDGDLDPIEYQLWQALTYYGLAADTTYFINFGGGSGTCPTLQEQLESYTGSFGNLVGMLNERNYNEYADASAGIYNDGYDYGYEEGYTDAVGLRGSLQAGQIRLLDEVLDFSAFSEDIPPLSEYTYTDNFNFHVFGGYHADNMIVQYSFGTGYQTLQYSFTDEDSGGLTLISRTTTNSIPDTTWLVPRARLIVIDSMPSDPRFVQFIEDNSSIIDGVQATTLYDYGYGVGYSEGWTNSAIGDAFKAPIDALNNMVLLETAGVTITLGGVILAMISMSIMIVFLKKFAGG